MLAVFHSILVHYSSGCYAGYNVQPCARQYAVCYEAGAGCMVIKVSSVGTQVCLHLHHTLQYH